MTWVKDIFEQSVMGIKFEVGNLNVPDNKPLPQYNQPTPQVLIGNKALPLKHAKLDEWKGKYNYRLCCGKDHWNINTEVAAVSGHWKCIWKSLS